VKLSRAAIALYVGLVFASGVVLGAFGQRLYTASVVAPKQRPNPEEFRKRVMAEYESRLKLNSEQVVKLNTIFDETRTRMEETRKSMHPAYQKIHEDQVQKIREILNADQQLEYDKMRKEREQKQKQGGRGL
jgi:hypothetical protein